MSKTKKQRQTDTVNMTKCPCGNVAGVNQKYCGKCREEREEANRPGLHLTRTSFYHVDNNGKITDL